MYKVGRRQDRVQATVVLQMAPNGRLCTCREKKGNQLTWTLDLGTPLRTSTWLVEKGSEVVQQGLIGFFGSKRKNEWMSGTKTSEVKISGTKTSGMKVSGTDVGVEDVRDEDFGWRCRSEGIGRKMYGMGRQQGRVQATVVFQMTPNRRTLVIGGGRRKELNLLEPWILENRHEVRLS